MAVETSYSLNDGEAPSDYGDEKSAENKHLECADAAAPERSWAGYSPNLNLICFLQCQVPTVLKKMKALTWT
jgi:hypothetical protein